MAELLQSVKALADQISPLDETKLAKAWSYDEYDEGVRFAALQSTLELRMLAVKLAALRPSFSQAERIMSSYHIATRELHGAFSGSSTLDMDTEPPLPRSLPDESEWSLREIISHCMKVALSFHTAIQQGLESQRKGEPPRLLEHEEFRPLRAATANQLNLSDEEPIAEDFAQVMHTFDAVNARLISDFAPLPDGVLDAPSYYWESTPYPIRFRLHRFEAHLRQHTYQVEKSLIAFGRPLTEGRGLARDLYRALGEVEAAHINAPQVSEQGALLITEQSQRLQQRAEEVATALLA